MNHDPPRLGFRPVLFRQRAQSLRGEADPAAFEEGIETYLTVLIAEQALYTAKSVLITTRTNLLTLYKAPLAPPPRTFCMPAQKMCTLDEGGR